MTILFNIDITITMLGYSVIYIVYINANSFLTYLGSSLSITIITTIVYHMSTYIVLPITLSH